jgi:D-amino peptidase
VTAVYISVDMEGVAGVADPRQVRRGELDYETARLLMTREASAAVAGAVAAGAGTVVVNDAHGDNGNILPAELDPRAELFTGSPKLDGGMMKGVDEGFDVALLIGYHARAGTRGGNLDHTVSSAAFADVRVNGQPWSEADLNCAIAGQYGVPVALFTGDDVACGQFQQRHPAVAVVVTKAAYGNTVVRSLHPQVACERITRAATAAVQARAAAEVYRPEPPFELEVDLVLSAQADRCGLAPGTERRGARTIALPCRDAVAVRNALSCFSLLAAPR